jgi:hypothetical protein
VRFDCKRPMSDFGSQADARPANRDICICLYSGQCWRYARRKGWSLAEAERWLSPILNYDPRHAPSIAAA